MHVWKEYFKSKCISNSVMMIYIKELWNEKSDINCHMMGEKTTRIVLLVSQSKMSGKWSWQYSSKLKSSTVKVTSFHFFGVFVPSGVFKAKFLMARLGSRAIFLYLISNPQSCERKTGKMHKCKHQHQLYQLTACTTEYFRVLK